MKVSSQDDDDNSVSEGQCEREEEDGCAWRESSNERSTSPTMNPVKSYDGTDVTATMTWASSFDLEEAMSTELHCIQEIFEPNDEQFHSFSEDTTNSNRNTNSIFRSADDCHDHEQQHKKQYGTLVRMNHANYAHETLMPSPRCILKSKTWNDRPSSPTLAKGEARRQFVSRHHITTEHHQLHNLVMGPAAA